LGASAEGAEPGVDQEFQASYREAIRISEQNVEIVKRLIDAFNDRDLDTFAGLTTPDLEWTTSMTAVEGEVFWGREGIETYFERMREAWEEFRSLASEYRDLGDRVLFIGRLEGRGLVSGAPVSAPLDILFDLRGGNISRLHSYLDHGEALLAAGLSE
jgi:ketosteroid isomerase-like protein